MRLLLVELQRNIGRKNGVDLFEELLAYFNLSGVVDGKDKQLLWQMHHIHNVIVHRASRADRRLIKARL